MSPSARIRRRRWGRFPRTSGWEGTPSSTNSTWTCRSTRTTGQIPPRSPSPNRAVKDPLRPSRRPPSQSPTARNPASRPKTKSRSGFRSHRPSARNAVGSAQHNGAKTAKSAASANPAPTRPSKARPVAPTVPRSTAERAKPTAPVRNLPANRHQRTPAIIAGNQFQFPHPLSIAQQNSCA